MKQRSDRERHRWRSNLRSLENQLQSLFDDLVFNAMSLFDYVGCLVGLAFSSRPKEWSKAVGIISASEMSSSTKAVVQNAETNFAKRLRRYRSEIIHFSRDHAKGWLSRDLTGANRDQFQVNAPDFYRKLVLGIPSDPRAPGSAEASILYVSSRVVSDTRLHIMVVLEALTKSVADLQYSRPPADLRMYVKRLGRDGLWKAVSSDSRLVQRDVTSVGVTFAPEHLIPYVSFKRGRSRELGRLDARQLFADQPPFEQVVAAVVQAVLDEL